MAEMVYDAFISYSHKDMRWARWLQQRLESFNVARLLRSEQKEEKKALRIFRDQTDLAGVELQASLQQELQRSSYMIVVCSPNSAASRWVNEEIRYFQGLGRWERIIPFIVSGEPESDNAELECYPEALRTDGDRHFLGANVRELGREKAFLKVLAVLLDTRFDRLVDRRRRQRIRTGAIIGAISLAVAGIVGLMAWNNSRLTNQNEILAEKNQELTYDIFTTALLRFTRNNELTREDVSFIEASANAGNPDAMLLLAECNRFGRGVEQNDSQAFDWYRKAAEAGNTEAMNGLGQCYWEGVGVEPNREQAFAWFLSAAKGGNKEAMTFTGQCYYFGYGTETNDAEAFAWLQKAAQNGETLGMFYMSLFYRQGIGTEVNDEASFQWMKQLAETGETSAMFTLGTMYQSGFGTPENPGEALRWYLRAANAGDEDAKSLAARCLEQQYGTRELLLQWYRDAADAGVEAAAEALGRLEETALPAE